MGRRPALVTEADLARAVRVADRCSPRREVRVDREGNIWLVPADHRLPIVPLDPEVDEGDDFVM